MVIFLSVPGSPQQVSHGSLLKEMAREYAWPLKRCLMALLLAGTIAGFLAYLSQYDFAGADISIDAADGHANYIGQNGDIRNGTYYGAETNPNAEESLPVEGDSGS